MTAEPTFSDLFRLAERSAVHLEMRDSYMQSDPSYQAWRAGERDRVEDNDPAVRTWLRLMSETMERGVRVRRARICSVPESDYVRFEHHVTDANVRAGEEVRWLPRRRASDLAMPGNDFWVFDDQLVVFLHFGGDGELSPDGDEERATCTALVRMCSSAFEAVWERAVPHSEYKLS
ncbi:hypothetical protein OKJ48_20240 [Streptomyces kunmingensis]|uniref:DUF6879 domain-containing protein n=1 Tax=Streptomyces kunmingensis TaxID=68225 RepID=A0ABU6CDW4_9ACTN|nr:DUF6879 family protein [Streptomyces kunmingensis]MEB3962565.1 hypothetical protein [Streptomyces kunmingensis]